MSIVPAILDLKETLQESTAIQGLISSAGWRSIKVKFAYFDREEIGMDECPIILITRPQVARENGLNRKSRGNHTVRLYFGFYHPSDDREKASINATLFEEAIEAAITADTTRSGTASATVPGQSINDEGTMHPVYFGVMEVQLFRRT